MTPARWDRSLPWRSSNYREHGGRCPPQRRHRGIRRPSTRHPRQGLVLRAHHCRLSQSGSGRGAQRAVRTGGQRFDLRDEAEVISAANNTRFGLAAGIFTRDVGRAPPGHAADPRRHRVGQHLPDGLAHRTIRRIQGQRLGPGIGSTRCTTTPGRRRCGSTPRHDPISDPFQHKVVRLQPRMHR